MGCNGHIFVCSSNRVRGTMKFGFWLEQSRAYVPNLQFCAVLVHHYPSLIPCKVVFFFMKPKCLRTPMAPISYTSSSASSSHDYERFDLESIWGLVVSVNKHILEFLVNPESRNSLKLRCTSKLKCQNQEFFEFSEHSVLSNLYWGIECIESAISAECHEEKTDRLRSCEQMLQVPALLDEHGVTAGISNQYLVCCSYFYLSVVRKLQRDELQVALHFFQALLVSPRLVMTEIAPKLCESLLPLCRVSERQKSRRRRSLELVSSAKLSDDEDGEAVRQMARRCKDRLMYYQVMLYGETPQWHRERSNSPLLADESQFSTYRRTISTGSCSFIDHRNSSWTYHKFQKVHPLDPIENITDNMADKAKASRDIPKFQDYTKALTELNQESENYTEDTMSIARRSADDPLPDMCYQKQDDIYSTSNPECTELSLSCDHGHLVPEEANEVDTCSFFSGRIRSSSSELNLSNAEFGDNKSHTFWNCHVQEVTSHHGMHPHNSQLFTHMPFTSLHNYWLTKAEHQGSGTWRKQASGIKKILDEECLLPEKDSNSELVGILEKAISKLCFSGPAKCDEDYSLELSIMYETLNKKFGANYTLLKNVILDILLTGISTSKEEGMIRASVSILITLVSENKSSIEDIKKKGLRLYDLANALKRNVHEAVILIYLINPSPAEIKTLELLPTLVEIVCTSNNDKGSPTSLLPTPPAASLMIIEVLVTAYDYATNNMHLAAITTPQVLSSLLDVAKNIDQEEFIAFATILVKCMRFDGECRKYISQHTPVAQLICLLRSNKQGAKSTALELFHEILHIPRSSAIGLLQQIKREGSINIMHLLMPCLQQLQPEYQLLAADVLLQLDLLEDSSGKSIYREEAVKIILESVKSEKCYAKQQLSTFILSNIGGTYTWTGEPYTVAWLVKKAGLNSLYHRNMIRNFDWLDQSLQDAGTDAWCSKIARTLIKIGNPVFHALEKGLKSKIKRVSWDCLTAIAWFGYEIAKSPNNIRNSACDIVLTGIEQFLHPGSDLDERLLACLCIYNYTSGKGMQKLVSFSEGVRESLRRLSNITWMADELLKVADYFLPNKSRISCVHTQILEAGHNCSGAINALIYYKGQLYSGYSDGSIKVWDINGQSATLVLDMKEHKKAVTCFSLFEPGDSLLSGSADKTIRVWQMVQKKLECIEVIAMKEPIQSLDTYRQLIFVITQSHGMKVFDASRTAKDICKSKKVKCIRVVQGKIYIGCKDSSIQELTLANNRKQEIKEPVKSWRMQNRSINSIVVFRDWIYSASVAVEGSNCKEWIRHGKPQMSIATGKGANLVAMGVVEDFIYLNCSSSMNTLQIWLRGSQQKVGRLSAGSKITSLLTANDIVICGTESGLIKGWIPL